MDSVDIQRAIDEVFEDETIEAQDDRDGRICMAIETLLPVLENLKNRTGIRFWLSWGIGALVSALREYYARNCD